MSESLFDKVADIRKKIRHVVEPCGLFKILKKRFLNRIPPRKCFWSFLKSVGIPQNSREKEVIIFKTESIVFILICTFNTNSFSFFKFRMSRKESEIFRTRKMDNIDSPSSCFTFLIASFLRKVSILEEKLVCSQKKNLHYKQSLTQWRELYCHMQVFFILKFE